MCPDGSSPYGGIRRGRVTRVGVSERIYHLVDRHIVIAYQCQTLGKYLQVQRNLRAFQMFTGPLFQIKLHLLSTVLLSRFQSFEIH